MNWFHEFGKLISKAMKNKNSYEKLKNEVSNSTAFTSGFVNSGSLCVPLLPEMTEIESPNQTGVRVFSFSELAAATKNFRPESYLGGGRGSARVYKGRLKSTKQVVAIKQVNHDKSEGNPKFLDEIMMLSQLQHPNLVNLIGYCADGDHQLIVQEFMPLGSLKDHLPDIDLNTRMKIAAGVAKGLEFLHNKENPHVILRYLTCSNILLGEGYHPKLSDFGFAKSADDRIVIPFSDTFRYLAPEYVMTGISTSKCNVYTFGVVLLEIITGKKAYFYSRAAGKQNLADWVKPFIKDQRAVAQLVDPLLKGQYPPKTAYRALVVAASCFQEQPETRPVIAEVVAALDYLASETYNLDSPPEQIRLLCHDKRLQELNKV